MTREEANKIILASGFGPGFLKLMEDLGVLKFEEPNQTANSIQRKIKYALSDYDKGIITMEAFINRLDNL